jgi:hypothetical protein
MNRRDLSWRFAGFVVSAAASYGCVVTNGAPLTAVFFPFVFVGIPLMMHGKRVGQVFRAERAGHSHTAKVVHAARRRRRR